MDLVLLEEMFILDVLQDVMVVMVVMFILEWRQEDILVWDVVTYILDMA